MKRALLILLFALWPLLAHAVTHPNEKLRDPALEARALNLTSGLRCVVCQNESIEASQADIARDLRLDVRRQLLDGKTDDEIRKNLVSRYGDYILLQPPVTSRTYALWLAPLLALAASGVLIALTFRNPKKRIRKKRT